MTIIGIGVDVLHLPRVTSLISRRGVQRFANRILSAEELSDWNKTCLRYLAVRFSVKEAAYKAMYPFAKPSWKDLTFKRLGSLFPGSKPVLLYNPRSPSDQLRLGQIHVSVSHEVDYVFSTVIVESP